jgi:hypothetical protein
MDNIDFALLRKLLKTQDMGEKGIERICNELKDGTFNPLRDPVTNVIIWAISDIQDENGFDLHQAETNFRYVISQLGRAKDDLKSQVLCDGAERQ